MTHRFTEGDFDAMHKLQDDAVAAIKRELQRIEDGEASYSSVFLNIEAIAFDANDWRFVGEFYNATPLSAVLKDAGRAR